MSDSLVALVTALADDELVLGHRHSEWTGFAPQIEEDVAFSSIAQDEIGHAAALYGLVASITGDDPDRLGLGRDQNQYRHAVLCERPNRDWAYTLARHWLYDHADAVRLAALTDTADERLGALVNKMRREERYHLIHADTWMQRISHGPMDGRTRLMEAVTETVPEALDLFEPIEAEDDALKQGWLPAPSDVLRARFVDETSGALEDLALPAEVRSHLQATEFVASSSGDLIDEGPSESKSSDDKSSSGGRRGNHTSDFGRLWSDLTHTYRAHPGASW